ncbi:MAG TPA: YggS family pyridoxal phosphate-dependent enzyme [Pedococcus sp.]|nr:YggS family pyridoxal phosphate-dependent enzyme [Pedococcus sp.]
MSHPSNSSTRRTDLEHRLATVRSRIADACDTAGRDPDEVTLVAVTKFFPAADLDLLVELGIDAVGENRDQEAAAKLASVRHRSQLTVHFIGQLQTNKAPSVVRYADVIQSVDRPRLVAALDRAAAAAGVRPSVLVQVSLDPDPHGRGGVPMAQASALAEAVGAAEHLRLRGVMAVAPLGVDPAVAFGRLREVAGGIREVHPDASWISAGMSGDLEAAIAHGATHLRVGSAILGSRQSHG